MYNLLESMRSAFQAVWAHRLRSFLTTLGIIIGVAAVVAVVSLVQGLSHYISGELEGLGSNTLSVQAFTPFEQRQLGQYAKLTHEDLLAIQNKVPDINNITPMLRMVGSAVQFEGESTATRVLGTTTRYMELNQVYPVQGRFISPSDGQTRRRVVVLGQEVQKDLRLPEQPVGEFVQIGGEWFKVIGVMESQGEILGFNQDDYVIVPYGTARSITGTGRWENINISLTVDDLDKVDLVKNRIERVLRNAHNLQPGDENDFEIQTPEQMMESFTGIIDMVTLVLGGIVGISLLVGGVGIMNIMLVSVTERTREIGICKALGAQRRDILLQFLIEALTLCMLGGLIGIFLGYGLGAMVSGMLPGFPAAFVPWWAVFLAFGFSASVGIIFGILPAAKAANLDPIEALRYE